MATTKKAPAKRTPAKATATKAPATKKAAPANVTTRTPEGAVFTNNGEAIVRTRPYSLSFMAQEHGRGCDEPGKEVGVARFREILAKLGVKDPLGSSWEVTLPNGHVVGFKLNGKAAAAPAKRTPAKATTKAPAKRAPRKGTK